MRFTFFFSIGLLTGIFSAAAETHPVQEASQGRFDLTGDPGVGQLNDGTMSPDDAQIGRQNWNTNIDEARTYTVNFPIDASSWTNVAFTFTPASNGIVTLTLRGPWEQSPDGPIYRQDVLWDACSATNTTLANGSFETATEGVPDGWTRPYGDAAVLTGPVKPVNGTNYARVWHDGPLETTLKVTGGRPVTLHFQARAGVPAKPSDLKPVSGTNAPAH